MGYLLHTPPWLVNPNSRRLRITGLVLSVLALGLTWPSGGWVELAGIVGWTAIRYRPRPTNVFGRVWRYVLLFFAAVFFLYTPLAAPRHGWTTLAAGFAFIGAAVAAWRNRPAPNLERRSFSLGSYLGVLLLTVGGYGTVALLSQELAASTVGRAVEALPLLSRSGLEGRVVIWATLFALSQLTLGMLLAVLMRSLRASTFPAGCERRRRALALAAIPTLCLLAGPPLLVRLGMFSAPLDRATMLRTGANVVVRLGVLGAAFALTARLGGGERADEFVVWGALRTLRAVVRPGTIWTPPEQRLLPRLRRLAVGGGRAAFDALRRRGRSRRPLGGGGHPVARAG